MESGEAGLTLVMTAQVPASGVADFATYEATVLALLAAHGGRLQRRLRSDDGTFEVHILRFRDEAALAQFRADPRRAAAQPLLERSGAKVVLSRVADVA